MSNIHSRHCKSYVLEGGAKYLATELLAHPGHPVVLHPSNCRSHIFLFCCFKHRAFPSVQLRNDHLEHRWLCRLLRRADGTVPDRSAERETMKRWMMKAMYLSSLPCNYVAEVPSSPLK